jgi:hypothetical protein
MDNHRPGDYIREPVEPTFDPAHEPAHHPGGSDRSRVPREPGVSEPRDTSAFATIRRLIVPAKKVFLPKRRTRAQDQPIHEESVPAPTPELRERQRGPRRRRRGQEPSPTSGLSIRPEESRLLVEVGKFRIIAVGDLEKEIYHGNHHQLRQDLEFLKQHDLIERHFLNLRRDGQSADARRFEAITLTKAGKEMLVAMELIAEGQRVYSGLVKPREAEHDAQLFRAYLKEAQQIGRAGGTNLRVRLDFELKAKMNRALHQARQAESDRDPKEIKVEVARLFDLQVQNDRFVVPDARLEYDLPGGGSAHLDIEVATAAYRHGHLAAKAKAGFKLYISDGDAGRLGAAVDDDHDLMSEILSL